MRTWLALCLGLTLALASAVPSVAMEATTDEEGVYSAEAAMSEDGYTWDGADGFFARGGPAPAAPAFEPAPV